MQTRVAIDFHFDQTNKYIHQYTMFKIRDDPRGILRPGVLCSEEDADGWVVRMTMCG
jgi:hypothetical protein